MGRSDRLFEIIQLLRRARLPVTADKIAHALEVTVRTVYRDIAALQLMRVPIEGEAGVGYPRAPGSTNSSWPKERHFATSGGWALGILRRNRG